MATFTVRGYSNLSAMAMLLVLGGPEVAGWTAPLGNDLTVVISRFDGLPDDALVAPAALWFTATVTGARGTDNTEISEPAGDTAVADRTAVECAYDWNFGDPGYVPIHEPNIATWMRDTNRASVKRPCKVMHSPGNKNVSCMVTDAQGGVGVGFFTFGPGGDAPAIADPETHFTGRRVYFSQDGIFPAGSATADQCTTVAAVHTRLNALVAGGATFMRVDTRRTEVYTDIAKLGADRNLYIGAYGTGARPRHVITGLVAGRMDGRFQFGGGVNNSWSRLVDQDLKGCWDAATETGQLPEGFDDGSGGLQKHRYLVHRCSFDGFSQTQMMGGDPAETKFQTFSDTRITNWANYGTGIFSSWNVAVIGCDFGQNPDALFGVNQGAGSQNDFNWGVRHGPIRHDRVRHLYVACNSFFSNCGWSVSNGNWNTDAPTTAQLAYRHSHDGASLVPVRDGGVPVRSYIGYERNSFEGGPSGVQTSPSTVTNNHCNAVFDSNIFCGTCDSATQMLDGCYVGSRFTNNYFVMPAVQTRNGAHVVSAIMNRNPSGTPPQGFYSPMIVANNTAYILATSGQLGGAATRVLVTAQSVHTLIEDANLYYAPNFTTPIGGASGPFDTPTLVGFASRHRGRRWNHPPLGHPKFTPSSWTGAVLYTPGAGDLDGYWLQSNLMRIDGSGNPAPGPVAPGDRIRVPYPDYSAFCEGVLGQVTRQMCESALPAPWSGARYHKVGLMRTLFNMAPASAGGDGRVAFTFTDTHIVIENLSGVTWNGSDAWQARIWIQLDLREHLMSHQAATASPATLPLLRRQAADTPRLALAKRDITGVERATTTRIGAFEALPV